MTNLEWFAVILSAIVLLKIFVVLIKPKAWFNYVAKPILGNSVLWGVIFLALFVWTGNQVLERYSIVEVMSMLLPLTFLMMLGALPFSKTLMHWYDEMATENNVRKAWLPILIWAGLAVWAFYALFFS